MPGDYDGDSRMDIAVYRPSTAAWWILKSSTNFSSVELCISGASARTFRCRATTTATAGWTSPCIGRPPASGSS